MTRETLVLSRADVAGLLELGECIEAVEIAFRYQALGELPNPAILGVHVPDGGFHIKAASMGSHAPFFAAKINANFPGNPAGYRLPTIQGVLTLFDTDRGSPLAIMDSMEITVQRTAAATGVAARILANPKASVATIVGCGVQGQAQLEALCLVRPITRAYAIDINDRARDFARRMSHKLGIEINASPNIRDAAHESDIIVTCTPSTSVLLHADDVRPGTFVAGVGADNPIKQELDPHLLKRAKLVVDNLEQCLAIGDLHHAVASGVVGPESVHGELGEVLVGRKVGRVSEDEIIVFDSTGTALQDVAAAVIVYRKAISTGKGNSIRLGE